MVTITTAVVVAAIEPGRITRPWLVAFIRSSYLAVVNSSSFTVALAMP